MVISFQNTELMVTQKHESQTSHSPLLPSRNRMLPFPECGEMEQI